MIPETVAFQMTSMLRDVIERGTGASARTLGVRGPVAGKTGTTDDYNDAWFVGFSTTVVVGGVGRLRPARADRTRCVRRARRAADLGGIHEADGPHPAARRVQRAERSARRGTVLASRTCVLFRDAPSTPSKLKDDDKVPSGLCTIHRGTFEQQVKRTVEGIFRGLGSKIAASSAAESR